MSHKQEDILRILCAMMAGLISILLAHSHSFADENIAPAPPCSHMDYQTYLDARETEPLEGTPAERLAIGEAYLARCAARPEAGRVALHAARNALDTGDATRALEHFDTARARFASFQHQSRMDYMTTLILNGQAPLAWSLRDEEVELWLDTLDHDGLALVETVRLRDGLVHKITYNAVDPKHRESVAWLAAPFGAGFPATISLSADQNLAALLKLRIGDAASGLQELKLHRCHGQNTLLSTVDGIEEGKADTLAMAAAKAYLANPDGVLPTDAGQPIATCFQTERLFIAPDPGTAETLY